MSSTTKIRILVDDSSLGKKGEIIETTKKFADNAIKEERAERVYYKFLTYAGPWESDGLGGGSSRYSKSKESFGDIMTYPAEEVENDDEIDLKKLIKDGIAVLCTEAGTPLQKEKTNKNFQEHPIQREAKRKKQLEKLEKTKTTGEHDQKQKNQQNKTTNKSTNLSDKDLAYLKLTKTQIKQHYQDELVSKAIRSLSNEQGNYRAGNIDRTRWYKITNKKYCQLWDLTYKDDYLSLIKKGRSLYWTLNFFHPSLKQQKIHQDVENKKLGTFKETETYSLGIDIDGKDEIFIPEVKKAVEAMAQYFCDELRKYCPKSIYSCFSGGGIYVYVHQKLYYQNKDYGSGKEIFWRRLTSCFNAFITDLQEQFYKKYPEYKPYVKADAINNSKRVFKSIFSIHKKYNFAVIPLDVKDIKINFTDANIPLSAEIKQKGLNWMKHGELDESIALNKKLKKYLNEIDVKTYDESNYHDVFRLNEKADEKSFPPCIKKILAAKNIKNGATRMKTLLAIFLGQAGYEKTEAHQIFKEVTKRIGGPESNIFESWYNKISCPSCKTIQRKGSGFPHMNMGEIGICHPNSLCTTIKTPVDYLIHTLKIGMTGEELTEKIDTIRTNPLAHILSSILEKHTGTEQEAKTAITGLLYILRVLARKDSSGILKVSGSSSAGKSNLTNTILECFPQDWIKTLGSISANALKYIKWNDEKILYIQEAGGAEETTEHLKLMDGGDGGFKAAVTVRAPDGGFTTEEYEVPVKFIITTRAEGGFDQQLENRMFNISIDESDDQTFRVLLHRCKAYAGHLSEPNFDVIKKYFESLQQFDQIEVPYSYEFLNVLERKQMRVRRDIDKILSLCQTSAFLNQSNRPVIRSKDNIVLYATPEDAYNVFTLAFPSFEETVTGVPQKDKVVYNALPDDNSGLTYRDLAKKIGWYKKKVMRTVEALDNKGYVDIDTSAKSHIVRKVKNLDQGKKDFQQYKMNFLAYTAADLCSKNGKCDIPLCWFDINEQIKRDTDRDKLRQISKSPLLNRDTDWDNTGTKLTRFYEKEEINRMFGDGKNNVLSHPCLGFVSINVSISSPVETVSFIKSRHRDKMNKDKIVNLQINEDSLAACPDVLIENNKPMKDQKLPLDDIIKEIREYLTDRSDVDYQELCTAYGQDTVDRLKREGKITLLGNGAFEWGGS